MTKIYFKICHSARSRTNIDLPGYSGTHEYSIVPKTLFTADGNLQKCNDKATIACEIYDLQVSGISKDKVIDRECNGKKRFIIFDACHLLTSLKSKSRKYKHAWDSLMHTSVLLEKNRWSCTKSE